MEKIQGKEDRGILAVSHDDKGLLEVDLDLRPKTPQFMMEEARRFFVDMGLKIGQQGLLSERPSKKDIQKLKIWRQSTMGEGGIEMPDEDTFYKKVLLCVSLYRQKDKNGGLIYVLGKGIAAEIALQGTVKDREIMNDSPPPYRSHSDFEIYGAAEQKSGELPYSEAFREIFGAQEYLTGTKGMRSYPRKLLLKEAEEVDLGGLRLYIPRLEVLYLDKFLRPGIKERPPGENGDGPSHDSKAIRLKYRLDGREILEICDEYYEKPTREMTRYNPEEVLKFQRERILKALKSIMKEEETKSVDRAAKILNGEMADKIQDAGMFIITHNQRGQFYPIVPYAIYAQTWRPLDETDVKVSRQGELIGLSETYLSRLKAGIVSRIEDQFEVFCIVGNEIKGIFALE